MKCLAIASLSALLVLFARQSVLAEDGGEASPMGLAVSISPTQRLFATGDVIAFTVTVKNVSAKAFRVKQIARVADARFQSKDAAYVGGGQIGDAFKPGVGMSIRLASARGQGAPPPGEDVPSTPLKPGASTTFDLLLRPGAVDYATGDKPVRLTKQLPPGKYRAKFTFDFPPPMVLKEGQFVAQPDPSFFTGKVTAPAVNVEIAR